MLADAVVGGSELITLNRIPMVEPSDFTLLFKKTAYEKVAASLDCDVLYLEKQ